MSSNLNHKDNAVVIHQLLEELQLQISVLEAQIETGLFLTQPENTSAEIAILEENSLALEDDFFLAGYSRRHVKRGRGASEHLPRLGGSAI